MKAKQLVPGLTDKKNPCHPVRLKRGGRSEEGRVGTLSLIDRGGRTRGRSRKHMSVAGFRAKKVKYPVFPDGWGTGNRKVKNKFGNTDSRLYICLNGNSK